MTQAQVEAILGPPATDGAEEWRIPAPHIKYATLQHWHNEPCWILVAFSDEGKVVVADCWSENRPRWWGAHFALGWMVTGSVGS
jgi:hypothetical protein